LITVTMGRTGVDISGHAGYDKHGRDIVCAAVSVLAHNLFISLEALTPDKVFVEERHGYMNIIWNDLSDKGRILVDSFFLGICDIERDYPGVEIKYGK